MYPYITNTIQGAMQELDEKFNTSICNLTPQKHKTLLLESPLNFISQLEEMEGKLGGKIDHVILSS